MADGGVDNKIDRLSETWRSYWDNTGEDHFTKLTQQRIRDGLAGRFVAASIDSDYAQSTAQEQHCDTLS